MNDSKAVAVYEMRRTILRLLKDWPLTPEVLRIACGYQRLYRPALAQLEAEGLVRSIVVDGQTYLERVKFDAY